MLFGEYDHQVYSKNRIRIPSKLKSELGSEYVFVKGAAKCISIYPADKATELVSQFSQISPFDKVAQESFSEFMASFHPGDEDVQGRVVIPEKLRIYAGIEKEVIFSGAFGHVEIWGSETWEKYNNNEDAISMEEAGTRLSGMGI